MYFFPPNTKKNLDMKQEMYHIIIRRKKTKMEERKLFPQDAVIQRESSQPPKC